MFRFLHIGDLHLGWEPRRLEGAKVRERQARRDNLICRAVDFALDEGIELVVIAGDLFETHTPSPSLAQTVITQLSKLVAAGVQVVTTPGNHDEITYANSVYNERRHAWPGLLVTNPTAAHVGTLSVAGESVHVYSLAYTGGVTPADKPMADFPHSKEPGVHLAVFHGMLGSGDARSLPLDRGALERAGYDYVALGHIHQSSVQMLGPTPVVYCGCQEGKGFDDPGVPYWTVVEVEGNRAKVTRKPLEVQPIQDLVLDLTPLETPEQVEEAITARADPDTIMRVRLQGSLHFELDSGALEARFKDAFYHFELRDESDAIDEALLESMASERTIQGMFVRQMWGELENAEDEAQRRTVTRALRYGIRALRGQA